MYCPLTCCINSICLCNRITQSFLCFFFVFVNRIFFFPQASIASCTAFFAALLLLFRLRFSFASTASAFWDRCFQCFLQNPRYTAFCRLLSALFTVLPSSVLEASVALSDVTVTVISFLLFFRSVLQLLLLLLFLLHLLSVHHLPELPFVVPASTSV